MKFLRYKRIGSRKFNGRGGLTLVEILIVTGIAVILSAVVILDLYSSRSERELDASAQEVGALLREAGIQAASGKNNSSWGVHFETSATDTFFALFPAAYSPAGEEGHYHLPDSLRYDTSSWSGNYKDIVFAPMTGQTTSTFIRLYLAASPGNSSTISVASSGAVSY